MPSCFFPLCELASGHNSHNAGNQQSTHSGHVRLGWKHRTSEQRCKPFDKILQESWTFHQWQLRNLYDKKILQCAKHVTTPFPVFLLKIRFATVSPLVKPHDHIPYSLMKTYLKSFSKQNPLIQPSFSLSFSHSRQYNGASLTLSKGVELRVPLDLSNLLQTKARNRLSWHCKFK